MNRAILILLLTLAWPAFQLSAQQSAEGKLFKETKARAEKGDPESQFALGGLYATGVGVDADPKKAAKWHRKAADQGLAQAQFQVALEYAQGEGVKEDAAQAVYWFAKAAEQGLVEAELELGRCNLAGKGVKPNGVEAMRWFRKAAAQGSVAAEYYLGKCFFDGTGVSRDIEEGLSWTRRAAEAGFALAQVELGSCYEKGRGVEKDYLQAYKWFALAAAQDDAKAAEIRVNIGKVEMYLTKEEVAQAQRLARDFKPAIASNSTAAGQQGSESGFVTVTAEDGLSEVFADGSFVGNAPAKLKLKEGVHLIEVKRAGFKDYRREINITPGSDLNLKATLERQ